MTQPVEHPKGVLPGEPTPHYADYCLMTDEELAAEVARMDSEYLSRLSDSELEELLKARGDLVDKARDEYMNRGAR